MTYAVAYVPGAYDLFHIGHLNILRRASELADRVIAGVVSDEMCAQAKGSAPYVPLDERLEIVRAIRYVDEAVVEWGPDKTMVWRTKRFDVIVKGDDWRGTSRGHRLEEMFAPLGVGVEYLPYTRHTSSTQLRAALDVGAGRA